ncbi:unnamed protein product [Phaedon cochleariae]|uniref:Uncharacterized protein n=1 Tax=Phaedon cochleariae TaxID=80249 RepID=A0A9P0DDU5_PHACE|nr:unnamed protein product [Phaedon cochleariae]
MESDKENAESTSKEVMNIYRDMEDYDLGHEIEKLKEENNMLGNHIVCLEGDVEKLTTALLRLKSLQENLTRNISSLFMTAKKEIERKDRIIADLRSQLDDITFRRMGMRYQKRKPEETLEGNNKKPKYQENVNQVEQPKQNHPERDTLRNTKKSIRQRITDPALNKEKYEETSNRKHLVEKKLTISDERIRNNRTPEVYDDEFEYEDPDYYHNNRINNRNHRKKYIEDDSRSNYSRREEFDNRDIGRRHNNSNNHRYQRPDYGNRRDQRYEKPIRETHSENDATDIQNGDTSDNTEYSESDRKANSEEITVKPVRKKIQVISESDEERKIRKQGGKLTGNSSPGDIPGSSTRHLNRQITEKIEDIFTDGINKIMDSVLQDVNKLLPTMKIPPEQYFTKENFENIRDFRENKLQRTLNDEKFTKRKRSSGHQEDSKKTKEMADQDFSLSTKNENSTECLNINNFDYSSGESGTVRENIMKHSDMDSVLRQTLINSQSGHENKDILKDKQEALDPKHSDECVMETNALIEANIEDDKDKRRFSIQTARAHQKISNAMENGRKQSTDRKSVENSIADQKTKQSENSNHTPRMNPSYKIPRKDPSQLTKNDCNSLFNQYNPLGNYSAHDESERTSKKSEESRSQQEQPKDEPRSKRSRSEGRFKNRDDSPRHHEKGRYNSGYNPSHQEPGHGRSRSRVETENRLHRSRSNVRYEASRHRSRSIEEENRRKYKWSKTDTADTHPSRSTSRGEQVSRSRSTARSESSRCRSRSITELDETKRNRSKSISEIDEMNRIHETKRNKSKSINKVDEKDVGRQGNQVRKNVETKEAARCRSGNPQPSGKHTGVGQTKNFEVKESSRCRSVTPMPSGDDMGMDFEESWQTTDRNNISKSQERMARLFNSPDNSKVSPNNHPRKVIGYQQYTSKRLLDQKDTYNKEIMDHISASSYSTPEYEIVEELDSNDSDNYSATSKDRQSKQYKKSSRSGSNISTPEYEKLNNANFIAANATGDDQKNQQDNTNQVSGPKQQCQESSEEAKNAFSEVQKWSKPALILLDNDPRRELIQSDPDKTNSIYQNLIRQSSTAGENVQSNLTVNEKDLAPPPSSNILEDKKQEKEPGEDKLNHEIRKIHETSIDLKEKYQKNAVDHHSDVSEKQDRTVEEVTSPQPMDTSKNIQPTRNIGLVFEDIPSTTNQLDGASQKAIKEEGNIVGTTQPKGASSSQQRPIPREEVPSEEITKRICLPKPEELKTNGGEEKERKPEKRTNDASKKTLSDKQNNGKKLNSESKPGPQIENIFSEKLDEEAKDRCLPILTQLMEPEELAKTASEDITTKSKTLVENETSLTGEEKKSSNPGTQNGGEDSEEFDKSKGISLPLPTQLTEPENLTTTTSKATTTMQKMADEKVKKTKNGIISEEKEKRNFEKLSNTTKEDSSEKSNRLISGKSNTVINSETQNAHKNSEQVTVEPTGRSLPELTQMMQPEKLTKTVQGASTIMPKPADKRKKKVETETGRELKKTNTSKRNSPKAPNRIVSSKSKKESKPRTENENKDLKELNLGSKYKSLPLLTELVQAEKLTIKASETITNMSKTVDKKKEGQGMKLEKVINTISNRKSSEDVNRTADGTSNTVGNLNLEMKLNDCKEAIATMPDCRDNETKAAKEMNLSHRNVPEKRINDETSRKTAIIESVKNLTEESFSQTITIQSTPNKKDVPIRKRITPIPVKDTPICSFENILEKNKSPFSVHGSPLTLTHEGEIPVLHLEENHFNNLRGDGQKNIDRNIMSLLDQMNISNMDCDITKFESSQERTVNPSKMAVSFENAINTAPVQKASEDGPGKDAGDCTAQDKHEIKMDAPVAPSSCQNTSFVRRRRRCRLVVID